VEDLPPEIVGAMLDELTGDDGDPPTVGPVRLPTEQERHDAIRTARVPQQLRVLADYCSPPGRPLTGKGNLRLADARHLVTALDTGDDPELGGHRKLRSAEDLRRSTDWSASLSTPAWSAGSRAGWSQWPASPAWTR